jgi:hypothetical protein
MQTPGRRCRAPPPSRRRCGRGAGPAGPAAAAAAAPRARGRARGGRPPLAGGVGRARPPAVAEGGGRGGSAVGLPHCGSSGAKLRPARCVARAAARRPARTCRPRLPACLGCPASLWGYSRLLRPSVTPSGRLPVEGEPGDALAAPGAAPARRPRGCNGVGTMPRCRPAGARLSGPALVALRGLGPDQTWGARLDARARVYVGQRCLRPLLAWACGPRAPRRAPTARGRPAATLRPLPAARRLPPAHRPPPGAPRCGPATAAGRTAAPRGTPKPRVPGR